MEIHTAEDGYDAIAGSYDGWKWQKIWAALEQPVIRALLEEDRRRLALGVLDIGVGTGRNLDFIRHEYKGTPCAGIDMSSSMLALARARLAQDIRLEKGDVKRLFGFESSTFSHVLMCRVSSHIENLWPVVAEIARVLLPSGRALVTDLHPEHNYQNTHCHVGDRTIHIRTHKHDAVMWERVTRNLGLKTVYTRVVLGRDVAALPDVEMPKSILGPDRPVSTIMVLQKR